MHALQHRLAQFIASQPAVDQYCIAFSGGIDSTALLHAAITLSQNQHTFHVRAIHINHSLHVDADQWSQHCKSFCEKFAVPCSVETVDASPQQGESPEAVARKERYQALEKLLRQGECLLTAQHQDDQAETLLLQLLRGSGPAGLAAMPMITSFGQGYLARPWLGCSRVEIEGYAQEHKLSWVEDSSNQEFLYARNYLRYKVLPLLADRWPGFAKTVSRSARLQAEVNEILMTVAETDLQVLQQQDGNLLISALQKIPDARKRNVIRFWVQEQGLSVPSEAQLEQIIQACSISVREDAVACISWPNAEVRRYRDGLHALNPQKSLDDQQIEWDIRQPLELEALSLSLDCKSLSKAGLNIEKIKGHLSVRFRQGGEKIQLPGRSHRHRLKKILQEQGVPSWQRQCLPLLYYEGELIAVWGLESPIIAAEWLC